MKYFIIGLFIGIVSFIPGISGGTILYLSKEYENFTIYLKNPSKNKQKIIILLFGLLIGIFSFAPIIELCFKYIPNYTLLFFSYLLLFTLPKFVKCEKIKFKPLFIILGFLIIILLSNIVPKSDIVISTYPKINLPFLIFFLLCGFLDGFITIIPGISGSMILMILGPYYLYKSFCANVFNNIIFLIPLFFYFLGDIFGIIWGSKTTTFLLKKKKDIAHSLILGMVISSIYIIIPFNTLFTLPSLILLFIAYIITTFLNLYT